MNKKLTNRVLSMLMAIIMMLSLTTSVFAQTLGEDETDYDAAGQEESVADLPRLTAIHEGHRIHYIESPKHPLSQNAVFYMDDVDGSDIPFYLDRAAYALGQESCDMYDLLIAKPVIWDTETGDIIHFEGSEEDPDDRMTVEVTLMDDADMDEAEKAVRKELLEELNLEDLEVIVLGSNMYKDAAIGYNYDAETGIVTFQVDKIGEFLLVIPYWETAIPLHEEDDEEVSGEPEDQEVVPTDDNDEENKEDDGTQLPSDENPSDETNENDENVTPADGEGTPADGEGTPADGEGTPADGEGAPADGEGAPTDGEGAPADGEATPSDGEGAPIDGEGTPLDDDSAPVDGEGVPVDGEGAPADGEATPSDGEAKPADGEATASSETPSDPSVEPGSTENTDEEGNKPETKTEGTLTADGEDYIVALTYKEDANVPEGSELELSEYRQEGYLYENLAKTAADALNTDSENILSVTFVDVGIVNENVKVEPDASVGIGVAVNDPAEDSDYEIKVLSLGTESIVLTPVDALQSSENTESGDDFENPDATGETDVTDEIDVSGEPNESVVPDNAEDVIASNETEETSESDETTASEDVFVAPEGTTLYSTSADILNSTIAIVRISKHVKLKTSDDQTYLITVTYDRDDPGIPENVELVAEEITADDERYEGFYNQSNETTGANPNKITFTKAFDIKLVDSENGKECQPSNDVAVSILLMEEDVTAENTRIDVVHFGDDDTVDQLNCAVNKDNAIEFTTPGFSPFFVVARIIETYFQRCEGETWKITATYDSESGIPEEGVKLFVAEVEDDDPDPDPNIITFDIKLVDEEDESIIYQPTNGQSVSLSVLLVEEDAEIDSNTAPVIHILDDGTEETITAKLGVTEEGYIYDFETKCFSFFRLRKGPLTGDFFGENLDIYTILKPRAASNQYERISIAENGEILSTSGFSWFSSRYYDPVDVAEFYLDYYHLLYKYKLDLTAYANNDYRDSNYPGKKLINDFNNGRNPLLGEITRFDTPHDGGLLGAWHGETSDGNKKLSGTNLYISPKYLAVMVFEERLTYLTITNNTSTELAINKIELTGSNRDSRYTNKAFVLSGDGHLEHPALNQLTADDFVDLSSYNITLAQDESITIVVPTAHGDGYKISVSPFGVNEDVTPIIYNIDNDPYYGFAKYGINSNASFIAAYNDVNYALSTEMKDSSGNVIAGSDTRTIRFYDYDEATGLQKAICKIVNGEISYPFVTLQSAVAYAEAKMGDKTPAIEMLVDYNMPASDTVTISSGDITLTTATSEGPDGFKYNGSEGTTSATISRDTGYNEKSMITVSGGTLSLTGITLDGKSETVSGVTANGGIVSSSGTLNIGTNAVLKNSVTSGNGGAVYINSGSCTMSGGSITQNQAANGSAVFTNGVSFNMSGGSISGNKANGSGGAIGFDGESSQLVFSGNAVVYGNALDNTVADPEDPESITQSNVYLNQDTFAVIKAGDLNEYAKIGVYVTGEVGDDGVFDHRGINLARFGTINNDVNTREYLDAFINDRNGLKGAEKEAGSAELVWKELIRLTIQKQWQDNEGNPIPASDLSAASSAMKIHQVKKEGGDTPTGNVHVYLYNSDHTEPALDDIYVNWNDTITINCQFNRGWDSVNINYYSPSNTNWNGYFEHIGSGDSTGFATVSNQISTNNVEYVQSEGIYIVKLCMASNKTYAQGGNPKFSGDSGGGNSWAPVSSFENSDDSNVTLNSSAWSKAVVLPARNNDGKELGYWVEETTARINNDHFKDEDVANTVQYINNGTASAPITEDKNVQVINTANRKKFTVEKRWNAVTNSDDTYLLPTTDDPNKTVQMELWKAYSSGGSSSGEAKFRIPAQDSFVEEIKDVNIGDTVTVVYTIDFTNSGNIDNVISAIDNKQRNFERFSVIYLSGNNWDGEQDQEIKDFSYVRNGQVLEVTVSWSFGTESALSFVPKSARSEFYLQDAGIITGRVVTIVSSSDVTITTENYLALLNGELPNVITEKVEDGDFVLPVQSDWSKSFEPPVGFSYFVKEKSIKTGDYVDTNVNPTYTVSDGGKIITVTNSFNPIARVRNKAATSGAQWSKWTYFEALVDTKNGNTLIAPGAFDYAKNLTGDVEIETLLATHARYTMPSGVTFEKSANITLRTTQDTNWNPSGNTHFTSTITRGYVEASLITLNSANTSLTLENINFDGASESGKTCNTNGGFVKVTKGTLNVNDGTTMCNSTVTGSGLGGAIFVSDDADATLEVNGNRSMLEDEYVYSVIFENCKAYYGGAIAHEGAQTGTAETYVKGALFNNCQITSKEDKKGGGAVYSRAHSSDISYCKFDSCSTPTDSGGQSQGGAVIHCSGERTPNNQPAKGWTGLETHIDHCDFIYCISGGAGGAADIETDTVTVTNSSFYQCLGGQSRKRDGGAIDVSPRDDWALMDHSGSRLTVTGCIFEECSAPREGGAIRSVAEKNDISDTTFSKCKNTTNESTRGRGGALAFVNKSANAYATIAGCAFENCQSLKNDGGAIYSIVKTLTIQEYESQNTTFTNCSANGNGGAVYSAAGTGENQGTFISDCTIDGHETFDHTSIDGSTTSYTLADSTVNAGYGGGLYIFTGSLAVSDSTIKDCRATTYGGALHIQPSGTFTFTNVTIDGHDTLGSANKNAKKGGGVFVNDAGGGIPTFKLLEGSNTIQDCYAEDGGAVYLNSGQQNKGAVMEFNDSSAIIRNSASGKGAGIYISGKGAGSNVSEGAKLYLSGRPNFGGDDLDQNGNILGQDGNFRTGTLSKKTNGKKTYTKIRDDIYIAGYENVDAASLIVTGEISSDNGTIWVFAEKSPHYIQTEQFAVFGESAVAGGKVTLSDAVVTTTLKAFRNSADDTTSSNSTDSYLYGVKGTGVNINWSGVAGSRKVILKAVVSDKDKTPVAGDSFEIYTGYSNNQFQNPAKDTGGHETWTEANRLVSGASGVFYIGMLNYGTYYIKQIHDGTTKNMYVLYVDERGYFTCELKNGAYTPGEYPTDIINHQ